MEKCVALKSFREKKTEKKVVTGKEGTSAVQHAND